MARNMSEVHMVWVGERVVEGSWSCAGEGERYLVVEHKMRLIEFGGVESELKVEVEVKMTRKKWRGMRR